MNHSPHCLLMMFLFVLAPLLCLLPCLKANFISFLHLISFRRLHTPHTHTHHLPVVRDTFLYFHPSERYSNSLAALRALWRSSFVSILVKRTNFNFTSQRFQICIHTVTATAIATSMRCCVVNYMCMAIWQLHSAARRSFVKVSYR